MVNIILSAKVPVGDACHAAKDLCWCCLNYFLRQSGSDRWPFFLFSTYCWRFSLQSHAGWDKEANRAASRLLNSISTLKVGAPGRGARAGPNGEDKTKILCIFCFCWCCCCHSGVGKKELVTVAGGKAHLAHTSKALVKLYPKYFVPGHIESLNQVKQASSVGEEREGLISPANTAMQVGRSFWASEC